MFSWLWLIFIVTSVAGSVLFNNAMKIASGQSNPFVFSTIFLVIALTINIIFLITQKISYPQFAQFTLNREVLLMALFCGVGVVGVDLGFFFALKYGGLFTSNAFYMVGGLLITSLLAIILFGETITLQKIIGLVLGAISIILIIKP